MELLNNSNLNTSTTQPIIISLGYRCSVAGILKLLHRKYESYPFDWIISRLPIVKDCIQTEFRHFLEKTNYVKKTTHTTHYHEGSTPTPLRICNEAVYENTYYQHHIPICNSILARIPQPLTVENGDTYASLLGFNHRNIQDDETQEYYKRCIQRFYSRYDALSQTSENIVGLYIHPTITEAEYSDQHTMMYEEFREFYQTTLPQHWSVAFFIVVRTAHPYPITNHKPKVVECVYEITNNMSKYMRIYVVYTNRDFIDAGEIFMQNAYIETDEICNIIKQLE